MKIKGESIVRFECVYSKVKVLPKKKEPRNAVQPVFIKNQIFRLKINFLKYFWIVLVMFTNLF